MIIGMSLPGAPQCSLSELQWGGGGPPTPPYCGAYNTLEGLVEQPGKSEAPRKRENLGSFSVFGQNLLNVLWRFKLLPSVGLS